MSPPVSPIPFRFVVGALLVFLTVPRMAQPGMFGDGLVYAVISRNLAIGVGSLWAPTYSQTTWVQFFDHPPLGFALQAVFFWLLGDHLFVERLYSFVAFGLHALVLMAIWRRLQPREYDWLPLLFWILPSIVTWGAINNMLENTQALLTSAAVLLLVGGRPGAGTGASTGPPTNALLRGAAGGLTIAAAFLTKGPVGLFPLAVPALLLLMPKPRRPARIGPMTLGMIAALCACGLALAAYEPSRHALTRYVETQVAPSILGLREINEDRFPVFRHVFVGIAARMAALLALIRVAGSVRRRRLARGGAPVSAGPPAIGGRDAGVGFASAARSGPGLFLLVLAFGASVPITFSPKLAGHYFVPSVAMFALAFASFALGPVAALTTTRTDTGRRLSRRVLPALGVVLLAASVLVPLLHGPLSQRDAALMHDLRAIGAAMPEGTTIGSCDNPRAAYDWCLHSYVQRWYRVSLDARDQPVNGWLLQTDDEPCRALARTGRTPSCEPPPSCRPVARGDALGLFRCDP